MKKLINMISISDEMKQGFKKAVNIFKYLTMVFAAIYWIYMLIDDWEFIGKYWADNWALYFLKWFTWFIIYFMVFALYFWTISTIIIWIYYKWIKANKIK